MLKKAHLGILLPLNQGHTRKYAGHGPGYYPMIQNGPPAPARRLASFSIMDKSHSFWLRV